MSVAATILAVESRRQFAESLREQVAVHMPVHLSINDSSRSLEDAFVRSKELMQFATLQKVEWHLYLEDDQIITNKFFDVLPILLAQQDVDLWYLANRDIPIGQMGRLRGLRVNRIRSQVPGSHGLLYRTKFIATLQNDPICRPVDHWFWRHITPKDHTVYQVLNPVCARHVGVESTLHEYDHQEHLFTHSHDL